MTKNIFKRCIMINEERVCYVFNGELRFTPFARAHFEPSELEVVQGYASS